jgi:hypothetical protein
MNLDMERGCGLLGALAVLFHVPGSGEGRENRPQLRCGNASVQTSTVRPSHGHSQSAQAGEGGGEAGAPDGAQISKVQESKLQKTPRLAAAAVVWDCPFGVWDLRARRATHAESEHPSRDTHALGADILRAPTAKSSSQK